MGHDHHFLSRLDRIASAEVELALSLYRDHELVREVLSHAKLPDRAARVAISLDDPSRGPFIIVAQDGGFVTCLGRDMSPHGLPLITRAELDGIAGKVQKLRERLQMAISLTGGQVGKLLGRIFTAGPRLTREEVMGLSAMQPLLWNHFMKMLLGCVGEVHQTRMMLRNVRKPRHREQELLRFTWDSLWALGHLTVLVGIDGREHFDAHETSRLDFTRERLMSFILQQGVFALSVRGAWAASKIGQHLLLPLGRGFSESESFVGLTSSALGLSAIAHRHPELRAEAREALIVEKIPEVDERAGAINRTRDNLRRIVEASFEPDNGADRLALSLGRVAAHKWLSQGIADSPHRNRYASADDVPEDIAHAFASWHWGNTGQEVEEIELLFQMIPWVVRQEPEDLFLPAELMSCLRFPQVPPMALEVLLRPIEACWLGLPQPIRVPPTPGRNDPCLCGSGKKHKRCCGAWVGEREGSSLAVSPAQS